MWAPGAGVPAPPAKRVLSRLGAARLSVDVELDQPLLPPATATGTGPTVPGRAPPHSFFSRANSSS